MSLLRNTLFDLQIDDVDLELNFFFIQYFKDGINV